MRIKIIAVGKIKKEYIRKGILDYSKRLVHYIPFEVVEIKEEHLSRFIDVDAFNVLLDEKGKALTSAAFALFIEKMMISSAKDIVFFVGGPEGFSDEFRKRADFFLSLSKMTLPHEMARMVLVEQIYRAFTIIRGEKYHK
ncbi:MAG: 23S rRNA (pseudouridine(1915)-N(3))-methyltransferase RlmH [Caldisericaceae bacterium]|nr:23S rRNA (pseudouridine(1915)-N(3))-methyltransferase RlmH [Caldisericaceae bacterium]